ncbi:MAG: ZIP family metal transporter [Patescibacteria group bacterium]
MSDLSNIFLLSLLGGVAGIVVASLFLKINSWSKALSKYSTPFAAGVLLTVSFLGLLPEAVYMIGEQAFLIVFVSFIGSYLFENFIFDLHHHQDDDHGHHHSSSFLVIIGDTVHNFIDGVAIAAAYLINPGLGLATAVSSLLHEIPHEIGDFGILLKNGFSKRKVFWLNFLSSLSTVVGAVYVYYYAVGETTQGILMAIATGMFVYLGASDFLPKASKGVDRFKSVGLLLLGVILMYMTLALVPHSHDEHGQEESVYLEEELHIDE